MTDIEYSNTVMYRILVVVSGLLPVKFIIFQLAKLHGCCLFAVFVDDGRYVFCCLPTCGDHFIEPHQAKR